MGLINKIRGWWGGYETPPAVLAASSRSFKQDRAEASILTADVAPSFPIWSVDLIRKLCIITPDLSQGLKRAKALANVGFVFTLQGATDRTRELADLEIKSFFDAHPGLLSSLYRQIFIGGAVSCEIIPAMKLQDGVEEIRLVKVDQLRFKKESIEGKDGRNRYRFVPYQNTERGQVRLDSDLFFFEALETDEDSPYAIPPFMSAMRSVLRQHRGSDQLDSIWARFGLFGFLSFLRKKPRPRPGEDDKTFRGRLTAELKELRDSATEKIKNGIVFAYDDTTIQHNNVTGDARGFNDVWRANEEQISSGMDIDLFLLGRSYSYTEAYAKVASRLFILNLPSIQVIVERFLKKALTYHLHAKGFVFDRVSARWNKTSIDPEADANAEKAEWEAIQFRDNVLYARVNNGIINRDEAAQEMGYEKATGEVQGNDNTAGLSNVVPFPVKKKSIPGRSAAAVMMMGP